MKMTFAYEYIKKMLKLVSKIVNIQLIFIRIINTENYMKLNKLM